LPGGFFLAAVQSEHGRGPAVIY